MSLDATSYFVGPIPEDPKAEDRRPLTGPDDAHLRVVSSHAAPIDSSTTGQFSQVACLSDEKLLEQLCDGNQEALATLFRRYALMVRAVAQRILRDASEAEDLLQDVFLFIFRKRVLFDSARGSARSWIVQVTYHRAIDRRRYLASRHFYTSAELNDRDVSVYGSGAEVSYYEQSLNAKLGKDLLRKIEESLSEDQRRVLHLYFFEGYMLEEIALQLGQAVGNIRNHYYRGLEKMRKQIFAAKLRQK
jgi:RNA polymerase sigma-70 factor, ECF subfamily